VEGFFVVLGVIIMFGPIVWALTVGRKGGAPDNEDAAGARIRLVHQADSQRRAKGLDAGA